MATSQPDVLAPNIGRGAIDQAVFGLASLAGGIALVVLLAGWTLGLGPLIRVHPQDAGMAPSTALCLVVLSGALVRTRLRSGRGDPSPAPLWAAAAVAVLVVLNLAVRVSGPAPGLEALIWPAAIGGDAMPLTTALCLLLAAWCLAWLASPDAGRGRGVIRCATVGLALTSTAVVGCILDARAFHESLVFAEMAPHVGIAFLALFVALLLSRPHSGWVGTLLGSGAGSEGARRLLPLALTVPLLLCLIAYTLTTRGLLDANLRLTLLAVGLSLLAAVAVVRNAQVENAAERERALALNELNAALGERDLLLREMYQRIKSNLQQINALIMIESSRTDDAWAKAAFAAMAGRVHALGMVHQLLTTAARPSGICMSELLDKLCRHLAASHHLARRGIRVRVYALDEPSHVDVAASLGLLVNELVTNAATHAFPNGGPGLIVVDYSRREDGRIELTVADDGPGRDPRPPGAAESSGSRIVRNVVRQLKGEVSVRTGKGTAVTVTMPADANEKARCA